MHISPCHSIQVFLLAESARFLSQGAWVPVERAVCTLLLLLMVTLAPLPLQMELRALIHARQMWYHWSTSLASNKDTHTVNSSYWYIRLKVCCSSTSITHLYFYVLSICCPSLYLGLWTAKTFIENTVPRHRKIAEEKYSLNKTRQRLFAIWRLIFLFFFFFSVYLSLLSV